MNFAKFLRTPILQKTFGGCFWRFQSTEVRRLCLRLTVIGKSIGIIISHVVDAVFTYGNKVTVQNIFHLKFQLNVENVNQFPKENVTKLLEKLKIKMQHQINIIWFMFNNFKFIFWLITEFSESAFLISISVSWEVSFYFYYVTKIFFFICFMFASMIVLQKWWKMLFISS